MSEDKQDGQAKPVFDWANLGELQEAKQGYQRKATINVEDETPAPIKDRVEKSFAQNQPDEDGNIDTKWSLQECGTSEMAKTFQELARRYAKYRKAGQVTFRSPKLSDDDTSVKFAVKPFETRKSRRRLPGSETKQVDAKPGETPKPADVKPAPKPADVKPAPKPVDVKPAPRPVNSGARK